MSHLPPSRHSLRIETGWILVLLIAAGASLRLFDLGAISFRWDEDLSALAAKGIAAQGIPELPSGMIYLRGLLFSYGMALSGMVFGADEWAYRLPAAVVGIATIGLAFGFGKRLFDTKVGLVLAALVAFSAWDIEFSRYARMYAPFGFLYLLTLLLIFRYRVVEESLTGGVLAVASAVVTLSLHDLGYTLALAFLIPPVMQGREVLRQPRQLLFPAAACSIVAALFFVWQKIQDIFFYRAAALAGGEPLEISAVQPTEAGEAGASLAEALQNLLGPIRLPNLPALSALADALPWAAAGVVAAGAVVAFGFLFKGRHAFSFSERLMLAAIALCTALQLFNIALLLALGLAFSKRRGLSAFGERGFIAASTTIGAAFVLWLALSLGLDLLAERPGAGGVKDTVRGLLDYPSFFVFWGFPREYPFTSIVALIGGLWAFDRAARPEPDRAALFLLLAFALPVVVNGMFATRYGFFRYNVPFTPLFFAFVALGLVRWTEVRTAWLERDDRPPAEPLTTSRIAGGTALLVALVAAFELNPLRGWLIAQRDHAERSALYETFSVPRFRDFRSVSEYVARHADADDAIVAFDCREYFNYLGHLDYCLVSGTYRSGEDLIQTYVDDGLLRDIYVGTPVLLTAKELEQALRDTAGTTWLLASDSVLGNEGAVGKDFRHFVEDNEDHVVFVAPDGDTKVYRF